MNLVKLPSGRFVRLDLVEEFLPAVDADDRSVMCCWFAGTHAQREGAFVYHGDDVAAILEWCEEQAEDPLPPVRADSFVQTGDDHWINLATVQAVRFSHSNDGYRWADVTCAGASYQLTGLDALWLERRLRNQCPYEPAMDGQDGERIQPRFAEPAE